MTKYDTGLLCVILRRTWQYNLPNALALNQKVNGGGVLNEFDISFLEDVIYELNRLLPVLNRHPRYQSFATQIMELYEGIVSKALDNY